jgi:hypothetical protein
MTAEQVYRVIALIMAVTALVCFLYWIIFTGLCYSNPTCCKPDERLAIYILGCVWIGSTVIGVSAYSYIYKEDAIVHERIRLDTMKWLCCMRRIFLHPMFWCTIAFILFAVLYGLYTFNTQQNNTEAPSSNNNNTENDGDGR